MKPTGAAMLVILILLGCSKTPQPVEPAPAATTFSRTVISRETFTNPPSFTYELRLTNSTSIPADTETEWFAGADSLGDEQLFLTEMREENGMRVFTSNPWLFLSSATNQTVVAVSPGRPAEVFCFPKPPLEDDDQWSPWQKPTFTETVDSPDQIMDATQPHLRRTNTPDTRFELRFKFTTNRGAAPE